MKAFLDGIRTPKPGGSFTKQFLITVAILAFGFALGVLQKWMDEFAGSVFPPILLQLDLGNFFGRLGIWIVLGTALSVYAPSPLGASLRTAGFFLSMVAGYFLYCNYGLGFLPKTYMMMWIIAACLSWFPAYVGLVCKGGRLGCHPAFQRDPGGIAGPGGFPYPWVLCVPRPGGARMAPGGVAPIPKAQGACLGIGAVPAGGLPVSMHLPLLGIGRWDRRGCAPPVQGPRTRQKGNGKTWALARMRGWKREQEGRRNPSAKRNRGGKPPRAGSESIIF